MTAEELLERYAADERNFSRADLRGANLYYANLYYANLSGANLRDADLRGACLRGDDLRGVRLPAPTMMLLVYWGEVSDRLCGQLMRYDAANCPNGNKLFSAWTKDGKCPYNNLKIQRCAIFDEKRDLWRPGKALSAYRLMVALIREKCRDSDYHRKAKK